MNQAFGTKLVVGTYCVAELTSIGGLELSADTIESTTLDAANGYRTFIQGLKDGGEVSVSGFFKPGDTNGQKKLYDNFDAGTLTSCGITFPTAMSCNWAFSAVITGISTGAELEDGVTFESTLKVSGKPALNV